MFQPSTVAIIGISRSKPSLGHMILDNLSNSGYTGTIYLVNPKADEIASYSVYNEISAIPDHIDLAVVLTPPRFVPQIMEELHGVGCDFVSIITAGFSDDLNQQILAISRKHKMRVIGPNSMGTYAHNTHVSFSPIPIKAGSMGYISQSGSIIAVVQECITGDFGFSSFVSLGNKLDITETDIIPYLVLDDQTSVIAAYLESFSNSDKLRQQFLEATKQKPVILVKGGRTEEGSKAVSSHTGALAGNFRLTRSLMQSCGILLVPSIEQQISLARFIDKYGIKHHHGVVTISSAGGPGVLAADEIVEHGLQLASLETETTEKLKEVIPTFGNHTNPLDLVADAGIDRYIDTINIVKHDPNVSTIIVIIVHPVLIDTEPLLKALNDLDLPIICAYLGPEFSEFDHYDNLIVYQTTKQIAWILKEVNTYHSWKTTVDRRLDRSHLTTSKSSQLDNYQVDDLLQSYEFTYPQQISTISYSQALEWFHERNKSVVLKLDHPQFSHKTDSGGVILDLSTDAEFTKAWNKLQEIYNTTSIPAENRKIEIQEFYSEGIELVLGIIKDKQFGHFLLLGAGGTMVEILDDSIFVPLPTSRFEVKEALTQLKIFNLLSGYRGSHPVDVDDLMDQILQLDQLVLDHPEIVELDINPLYILPQSGEFVVLDARMEINYS